MSGGGGLDGAGQNFDGNRGEELRLVGKSSGGGEVRGKEGGFRLISSLTLSEPTMRNYEICLSKLPNFLKKQTPLRKITRECLFYPRNSNIYLVTCNM